MLLIDVVVGTRPNFVKVAAIMSEAGGRSNIEIRLVHTGQHYDSEMSDIFFEQLGLAEPTINLNCGSGSHAEQVGKIMIAYEQFLLKNQRPSLVVVVGDVNSTMACSLVASKLNIKVAHVEAGIRSGDLSMPEEINRIVTDSISQYHFTTSSFANVNLLKSGILSNQIFLVGNTMIDTLVESESKLSAPDFMNDYDGSDNYIVLTIHRPSNVESKSKLLSLIELIAKMLRDVTVIFPLHPRIAWLREFPRNRPLNILYVDPQPYLQFNYLVANSKGVITDSGGISEETTYFDIPCITLRDTTERPETVIYGTNRLAPQIAVLEELLATLRDDPWRRKQLPEFWDGRASVRIFDAICSRLADESI